MTAATKKTKDTTGSYTTLKSKLRTFFTRLNPQKFKEFLEKHDIYKNQGKWSIEGYKIRGRCRSQTHAGKDNNPSMVIDIKKGYSKCYVCGHYESDLGEILAPILQKSVEESLTLLQSSLDTKIFGTKKELQTAVDFNKQVALKNKLAYLLNQHAVNIIDTLKEINNDVSKLGDTEYYYAGPVLEYLERRDPLIFTHIENLPLGILPTRDHLLKLGVAHNVSNCLLEEMVTYLAGFFTNFYAGAMVFFYHNDMQNVSRFRLRLPDSTNHETGATEKTFRAIADPLEESIGIFGLGYNSHIVDAQKGDTKALLVEGEFDAMALMTNQLATGDSLWVPLSHGGNASAGNLSALEKTPISKVYYVPDNDAGGKTNTKNILQGNPGLSILIYTWSSLLETRIDKQVKDVSDAIKLIGYETVQNALTSFETGYIKRGYWTREEVKLACFDLDAEDDDDHAEIGRIVREYASCIGSFTVGNAATDTKEWITETLLQVGVVSESLSENILIDTIEDDSPEYAFMSRLTQSLEEKYTFVGKVTEDNQLVVWDKRQKNITKLSTSSDTRLNTSIQLLMGDVYGWVMSNVYDGVPAFITNSVLSSTKGKHQPRLLSAKILISYINEAMGNKYSTIMEMSNYVTKADGVHWLHTKGGDKLFVVNGKKLIMGSFEEDNLTWTDLECPIYEKYYFMLDRPAWTPLITQAKDLNKAPQIPLRTILARNIEFMDIGWSFVEQKSEAALMGLWATLSTVVKIFPNNFQFLASAERSSGKTALYVKAFGGGKESTINITEHTCYMDKATPAGLLQTTSHSARVLILDEFDNQSGSPKTQGQQEEVLTILRAASTGDGVIYKGTISGKSRTEVFSASAMVAGIDPNMNDANQTRFITTDLKSGEHDRAAPEALITAHLGNKGIEELRKWNTLSVFRHIPAILQAFKEVSDEVKASKNLLGASLMQRFQDPLLQLLSVSRAAYKDKKWLQLGRSICSAKSTHLEGLKTSTTASTLIASILATKAIDVFDGITRSQTTLIKLLTSVSISGDPSSINNSENGVWFHSTPNPADKKKNNYYLFIHWRLALLSELRNAFKKIASTPQKLKKIAHRHEDVLNDEQVAELVKDQFYVPTWLTAVSGMSESSVLDVTKIVQEAIDHAQVAQLHSTSPEYIASLPNGVTTL